MTPKVCIIWTKAWRLMSCVVTWATFCQGVSTTLSNKTTGECRFTSLKFLYFPWQTIWENSYVWFAMGGSFHGKVNLGNGQNEIFFDRCTSPLSIIQLAAIGAKLIGPQGDLQVDKHKGNWWDFDMEWPYIKLKINFCDLNFDSIFQHHQHHRTKKQKRRHQNQRKEETLQLLKKMRVRMQMLEARQLRGANQRSNSKHLS